MPLNDHATPQTRRLLAGVIACALIAPAPAFAQGAGDDQYKDPFPETTAQGSQATPTETTSDGLSDTPPTSGTTDSTASSGTSTDTGTSGTAGTSGTSAGSDSTDTSSSELARTGDDPWLIALAGGSLLLLGAGLRLRGGAQRRH